MIKRIASVVAAGAMIWLVGCSGESAVSVNTDIPSTSAALEDMPLQDVTSYGTPWGLSNERTSDNNYNIYIYNSQSSTWQSTPHRGIRISVSQGAKCYHLNAQNQIWWASSTANGQIPNPPTTSRMRDIGAGRITTTFDNVWVCCEDGTTWKYRMANGSPSWVQIPNNGVSFWRIAVDPTNGNLAAGIRGFTQVYSTNNESGWTQKFSISTWANDVALCRDQFVINSSPSSGGSTKYIGVYKNGAYQQKTSGNFGWNVGAEVFFFYYIGLDSRAVKTAF